MCVSVEQDLYDERKILMKMSSNDFILTPDRQSSDTPFLSQGLDIHLSSWAQIRISGRKFPRSGSGLGSTWGSKKFYLIAEEKQHLEEAVTQQVGP